MTKEQARAKYPHLQDLGLLRTLDERRHVIDWLGKRLDTAKRAVLNASCDTWEVKHRTFHKANAAYEEARLGCNWMKYHARAGRDLRHLPASDRV